MKQFSTPHLAALGVLAVLAVASVWAARSRPGRWLEVFSRLLALAILAGWVGEYVADGVEGTWSAQYGLPLQLTDAVSATAILALWTRRALLVELTYFWAMTASLQAILTPDLGQSFPSVYYFTYFTYHVGAVVAACLLVFGCRLYPRRLAAWRAFAATLCFAAIAGIGDVITGGNYMYLRSKPAHNSLLSVMGPWPWYIVSAAAVGLAMLLALGLLTDGVRRLDQRRFAHGGAELVWNQRVRGRGYS
ncbi:MAG: TIGR02206 family membrane protein [Actinobacteria bacterium]|nr:MAG: TIGR02206 family membrane protein [Actinomycetota bacterium]